MNVVASKDWSRPDRWLSKDRFQIAVTHRSIRIGHNNERLEFLGDSVLSLIISEWLFQALPSSDEGTLTRIRARLVRKSTLAEIGEALHLGRHIRLGVGELKSAGHKKDSILADAVEALLGIIYLDWGLEESKRCVEQWFAQWLKPQQLLSLSEKDPKTQLQEWLQKRGLSLPSYPLIAAHGEAHQQTFEVICAIDVLSIQAKGVGTSRRKAEQDAARQVLVKITEQVS